MTRNQTKSIFFFFAVVGFAHVVSCKSREFNRAGQVNSNFSSKPNCTASGQVTCVASCKQCVPQYFCVSSKPQCSAGVLRAQGGTVYPTQMTFLVEEFEGMSSNGGNRKGKYPPFNAFSIWQNGSGTETYDYPNGYDDQTGSNKADGTFYVDRSEYLSRNKFVGTPTEGIQVVDDVLKYPAKNGTELKLKFTETSNDMHHSKAVMHCQQEGKRLPTLRELFDFCAAGVREPNYGPNFQLHRYPTTARCADTILWSGSVDADYGEYAWQFSGNTGDAYTSVSRTVQASVRCVDGL